MASLGMRASRIASDPLRNFKFHVSVSHQWAPEIAAMGFTSVDGLNMSTEMIPYREGGHNTNPHKLPGMTDFSPLTMSSGVFHNRPALWNMAKHMFAVQWGNGTIGLDEDYRFDMTIRVYDHPVTNNSQGGSLANGDLSKPMLAYKVYNAWVANVSFGGLNAMENSVLIHQLTVHHEGLNVWFNESRQESDIPY